VQGREPAVLGLRRQRATALGLSGRSPACDRAGCADGALLRRLLRRPRPRPRRGARGHQPFQAAVSMRPVGSHVATAGRKVVLAGAFVFVAACSETAANIPDPGSKGRHATSSLAPTPWPSAGRTPLTAPPVLSGESW